MKFSFSKGKILPVEQKYSFAEQPTIFLEIIYSYTLQTWYIIIMLMRRSNISFSSIVKILLMDDFLPGRTFYWNYVLSPPLVDWVRWKQMKKKNLYETTSWGKKIESEIGMFILTVYYMSFVFPFKGCLVGSYAFQSSDFLQWFQWVLATTVHIPSCSLGIVTVSMNKTSKDVFPEKLSHTGCNLQGWHRLSVRVWQF